MNIPYQDIKVYKGKVLQRGDNLSNIY